MPFSLTGSVSEIKAPMQALASVKGRQALARALNHTADKAKTQVIKTLVKETGLRYGIIKRELDRVSGDPLSLKAGIKARGGYFLLSDFRAVQTKEGIVAAPWGTRQLFKRAFFIKKYGNRVYKRLGKDRFPIKKLYGPAIPKEMLKEASVTAFETVFTENFQTRLEHEMDRMF